MANQVEIFNINFGDTVESINKLKAELKETRKLFELAKPNTEEFTKYANETKRLDGTIKLLNDTSKAQINALSGINQSAKFASGSYGELKQKIEAQKKALLELNTESEDFANTQKELIQLQEQRIEIEKKIPSLFQERIKGAIDESNALKQLKIELKANQSLALNGDSKAAQKVAELKDKIDDLKDSTKSLQGSGVERLNTSMGLLTQGFADFDADKVKTGFKGIGAAMSAIPIILIIEGIKALIDNFDAVVAFTKKLTGGFSAAEKAVSQYTKVVEQNVFINKALTQSYDNQIALLTAQGASEKEIIEIKKKKIAVQIAEAEDIIRLNNLKVAEITLNDSLGDSIGKLSSWYLSLTGGQQAADLIDAKIQLDKKERTKEFVKLSQDAALQISASKNALLVLDAEAEKKEEKKNLESAKSRIALQKETNSELAEILKEGLDESFYDLKLEKDREIALQKAVNQITLDLEKQFIQNLADEEIKAAHDKVMRANTALINSRLDGKFNYSQSKDLRDAQMAEDLLAVEGNEAAKAEIRAKYREADTYAQTEKTQKDFVLASGLTNSLGDLSNALFQMKRNNLEKGSDEEKAAAEDQFNLNKVFAISTTAINGAAGVINAFTITPAYAGIIAAAGIAAETVAQIAVIGSQKFEYFDGGYTSKGNPYGKAQSMGNAQFHNNEYVIPHNVLSTPKGSYLAKQAESMRVGYSKSNVSGFFDGGFTGRSASANVQETANFQNSVSELIKSLPIPVVRVTDINKVSKSNEVGVNVSSLG